MKAYRLLLFIGVIMVLLAGCKTTANAETLEYYESLTFDTKEAAKETLPSILHSDIVYYKDTGKYGYRLFKENRRDFWNPEREYFTYDCDMKLKNFVKNGVIADEIVRECYEMYPIQKEDVIDKVAPLFNKRTKEPYPAYSDIAYSLLVNQIIKHKGETANKKTQEKYKELFQKEINNSLYIKLYKGEDKETVSQTFYTNMAKLVLDGYSVNNEENAMTWDEVYQFVQNYNDNISTGNKKLIGKPVTEAKIKVNTYFTRGITNAAVRFAVTYQIGNTKPLPKLSNSKLQRTLTKEELTNSDNLYDAAIHQQLTIDEAIARLNNSNFISESLNYKGVEHGEEDIYRAWIYEGVGDWGVGKYANPYAAKKEDE